MKSVEMPNLSIASVERKGLEYPSRDQQPLINQRAPFYVLFGHRQIQGFPSTAELRSLMLLAWPVADVLAKLEYWYLDTWKDH